MFKKHLKTDPTEIDDLYNLGVAYFNLRQSRKALEYFATIVELDDQNKISGIYGEDYGRDSVDRGVVFSNISDIYEKIGEHKKAELCRIYSDTLITGTGPHPKFSHLSYEEREESWKQIETIISELKKLAISNLIQKP